MKSKMVWLIGLLLFALYIYMAAFVMSGASAAIAQASTDASCGIVPDLMMFAIDSANLAKSFDCMGNGGRAAYHYAETRYDSIYPITYALFLSFALWHLFNYVFRNRKLAALASLIPIMAMCFDFMENHYLLKLLNAYPTLNPKTISSAALYNSLKWAFAIPAMLGFVVMGLAALVLKIKRNNYNLS
jgi:hypothetical protein